MFTVSGVSRKRAVVVAQITQTGLSGENDKIQVKMSALIGLNLLNCCLFPVILFISRDSCGTGFVLVTTTVFCCCSTVLKMEHFQFHFFFSSALLSLSPADVFLFLQNFYCHPPHESVSLLSCDFAVKMSNSAGILAAASILHKEVFYSELAALCCICIHICMHSASTVHVEQSIYVRIEKFAASVIL